MSGNATPTPRRKGRRILFPILALAALGGGGWAGWTFSPFHPPDAPAEAATPVHQVIDAGIFPVATAPGQPSLAFRIAVTATAPAPPLAEMRDRINAMLAVAAEMPLVNAPAFDSYKARLAMEDMARVQAPWIVSLEFMDPGEEIAPATEEIGPAEDAH